MEKNKVEEKKIGKKLLSLLPKKSIKFLGIRINEELIPVSERELQKYNISTTDRYQLNNFRGFSIFPTEYLVFECIGNGMYQPKISSPDGFS